MFNVIVRSVGIRFTACEKVLLCVRVTQRYVHVATVSWQILTRFGHEARCDAEFASDRLDGEPAIVLVQLVARRSYCILEQSSSICHASNFAKLESSLEDTRTTFGMPSFNIASELLTGVVDAVVVVLIVYRSCHTVSEHTLGQGRQSRRRVLLEELGCAGRVALGSGRVRGCSELVEFVLGCKCPAVSVMSVKYAL